MTVCHRGPAYWAALKHVDGTPYKVDFQEYVASGEVRWTDADLRDFAQRLAYRGCERLDCGACQRRLTFTLSMLERFIKERLGSK